MKKDDQSLYTVQRSTIHGVGLFAGRTFKKGDFLAVITGTLHTRVHDRTYNDVMGNETWINVGPYTYIEPLFPFSHINHSCNPNVGFIGSRRAYAIKKIEVNEELTYDYATTCCDARWHLRCSCGAPNCRGEVRSIHFLPHARFLALKNYIPTYFKKLYIQYHGIDS